MKNIHCKSPWWENHQILKVSVLNAAVLFALGYVPGSLHAAQLYVNGSSGDDSADCLTPATSCETISWAITKASSDDTVNISSGTYFENINLHSKDLTIKGENAANTIVDGSGKDTVFYISSATTTIENLTIQNGKAGTDSGGIHAFSDIHVLNSRIINNTGQNGGGVSLNGIGTSTIENSEVSGNSADVYGGGVHVNNGTVNFLNTTFSGNVSPWGAGLTMNGSGTVDISNCTFANNGELSVPTISNFAGTLRISNTILANNGSNCANNGPFTSLGHNLADDDSCSFGGTGDMQNVDPLLGALDFNDAGTKTHALAATSPAIDTGDDSLCEATDQRDVVRPQDGDKDGTATCDIGAYELSPAANLLSTSIIMLLLD